MRYFFLLLGPLSLFGEPVCKKCEVIREYNKEHPGNYEYYEDYLKAQKPFRQGSGRTTPPLDGSPPPNTLALQKDG
jgi:hypothetical protein